MTAPDEPARAIEHIREVAWSGAPWRLGFALDRKGRVWRVTIDPADAGLDIDDAALAVFRGAFALASAMLPRPEGELAPLAARFADTVLGQALAEIAAVEDEFGPDCRALYADLALAGEGARA
jgi:hypothetical protein